MPLREHPSFLPCTDDRCGWHTPQPPAAKAVPLDDETTADCVIIGAGYTGLACARRLAQLRPQWRIVLVDALRVGQAAAGRNSGYVMDVGHWQPALGPEGNRSIVTLSRHGIELLRERVEASRIECDWYDGGRYHVAVNRRGHEALEHFREGLDAMGEGYRRVDADELRDKLGTSHYRHGLQLPGGALVHPTRLVRGLARALPETVHLVESAPVHRVQWSTPRTVHTELGRIRCRHIVLATNGYTGAWGVDTGRILPMLTFASLTEPCAEPPGSLPQWGVVPEERMGSTVRLTSDRRLLFRSGVHYRARPSFDASLLEKVRAAHRRSLAARFPALANLPLSHTWGGVLGVTINNGTRFGRVGGMEDDVWCCAAHNGVGIALGTALGDLLAHEMLAEAHPLLEQARRLRQPGWLPPRPFLGLGIAPYTALLQHLAGAER